MDHLDYYADAVRAEPGICWRMVSRQDGYRNGSPTDCSEPALAQAWRLLGGASTSKTRSAPRFGTDPPRGPRPAKSEPRAAAQAALGAGPRARPGCLRAPGPGRRGQCQIHPRRFVSPSAEVGYLSGGAVDIPAVSPLEALSKDGRAGSAEDDRRCHVTDFRQPVDDVRPLLADFVP